MIPSLGSDTMILHIYSTLTIYILMILFRGTQVVLATHYREL